MLIFIDTEFTDFIDCHLISIGLVSERGEELYLEVPYPQNACSNFVLEVVVPLLNQSSEASCSKSELKVRILEWLKLVRHPSNSEMLLCFDYQTDWDLFADAFDNEIPSFVFPRLINKEISELLLLDFWKKNPELHEHHALHDARANAHAFRELH
jgi:hypothetical protein